MIAAADRELLELAAKAANIGAHMGYVEKVKDFDSPHHGGAAIQLSHSACTWNPLTDDGDALRLAVKLTIMVYAGDGVSTAQYASDLDAEEDHKGDPFAATRRAIVRAAAEIGRRMP